MPSVNLRPQGNGTLQGWTSFTGDTDAYLCIDDSDDITHDSGATAITLGRQSLGLGQMSFPFFLMAEHLVPDSIVVNVAAIRGGVNHPDLQIGFYRAGLSGFDAAVFTPGASYSVDTHAFTTNPITGLPWTTSDLPGLEVCVQSMAGQLGSNNISLISAALSYHADTNHAGLRPDWSVN